MGLPIDRADFTDDDYERFDARLRACLDALNALLARPGFGEGSTTLGAELEVSIIDASGRALFANQEAVAGSLSPQLEVELNRFNLEFNLKFVPAAGAPFTALKGQLDRAVELLDQSVAPHGGRVVPIGILPTLRVHELTDRAMTDELRFRALNNGLRRLRHRPFQVNIDGEEPLQIESLGVTQEGANTSFQIHLRVAPSEFVDTFNAIQLATPLATAVAVNSPTYLGRLLWDETRVALFKQATDSRSPNPSDWHRAARVPFGHGWLRRSALESFVESVALHPALIPILADESPLEVVQAGGIPKLLELRLHQGTVWQWNRPIYDPAGGGHLRIEMRAFPGGPTSIDMAANAAFLIGLAVGLRRDIDERLARFPFKYADYSFYRAAQHGLGARLLWPADCGRSPREVGVAELFDELLPAAKEGLAIVGVQGEEADQMLGVIARRIQNRQTGASWQRAVLKRLDGTRSRDEALVQLLLRYMERSRSGVPVAEWAL